MSIPRWFALGSLVLGSADVYALLRPHSFLVTALLVAGVLFFALLCTGFNTMHNEHYLQ